LTIPLSTKVIAKAVDEGQDNNTLYVLESRIYPGIDACMPGIGAFQITVAKNHTIHSNVASDLESLGNEANVLYWIVPNRNSLLFNSTGSDQVFEQYVVKLELTITKGNNA
jgi:hypothetical protein